MVDAVPPEGGSVPPTNAMAGSPQAAIMNWDPTGMKMLTNLEE